jgi:dihydrofolate reductase
VRNQENDISKVIITCAMTVDGLIEAPVPAPDGWLIMEGDHEPGQFELLQNAAGMLLGRKNYEGFAAVWPSMAGDGRWADLLNPMRKWGGIDYARRSAGVECDAHRRQRR